MIRPCRCIGWPGATFTLRFSSRKPFRSWDIDHEMHCARIETFSMKLTCTGFRGDFGGVKALCSSVTSESYTLKFRAGTFETFGLLRALVKLVSEITMKYSQKARWNAWYNSLFQTDCWRLGRILRPNRRSTAYKLQILLLNPLSPPNESLSVRLAFSECSESRNVSQNISIGSVTSSTDSDDATSAAWAHSDARNPHSETKRRPRSYRFCCWNHSILQNES